MRAIFISHTYIVDLNLGKLRRMLVADQSLEILVLVPEIWIPGGVQSGIVRAPALEEGRLRRIPVPNFTRRHIAGLAFQAGLIKQLVEFRPDVIQVEQGSKSLAYGQSIIINRLFKLGAKNVFFTFWNLPYCTPFPINCLEKFNLGNTDGAITAGRDGIDVLRQQGYNGPVTVIPQLGVDETIFCPTDSSDLRSKLGIMKDEFVIGYVGRLVPEKGLLTLLAACQKLQQDGTHDWKLLMVGQGPLQEELLNRARAADLQDKLIIQGAVPHDIIPKFINCMDVLVLPSETATWHSTMTAKGWTEQFGHVLIEAMACKVSVIGSDSGEIPFVIADAGLIFPEKNSNELYGHIKRLVADPVFRKNMAGAGYQRALQNYTNNALAIKHCAFFSEILGERR